MVIHVSFIVGDVELILVMRMKHIVNTLSVQVVPQRDENYEHWIVSEYVSAWFLLQLDFGVEKLVSCFTRLLQEETH